MVLILDGNLEIGAHIQSNPCYLISLRHLIRSRAWIRFFQFSICISEIQILPQEPSDYTRRLYLLTPGFISEKTCSTPCVRNISRLPSNISTLLSIFFSISHISSYSYKYHISEVKIMKKLYNFWFEYVILYLWFW